MATPKRKAKTRKRAIAETSAAPRRGSRRALRIGTTSIRLGEVRDVRVAISDTYVGGGVSLPVRVIRGPKPGPTVFAMAAVHGDEINGTGILRELMYNQMPKLRAGSLICIPVVNVFGFETRVRYMPDRRDLNRCFPGLPRGSHASRFADTVFREIVKRCDYGIDLHSAAVHRVNFPNIRADLEGREVTRLAEAFGCEVIVSGFGPEGSLRRAACDVGCPTIVFEAGQVGRIESFVVEYGLRGVRNVLRHLGMLEGAPEPALHQLKIHKTRWVRAEVGGLLRFHVTPGDVVRGGQQLATNESVFGKARTTLIAPTDAIVLGMTTHPAVKPGEPVCHLGLMAKSQVKNFGAAVHQAPPQSLMRRTQRELASAVFISGTNEPEAKRSRRHRR